MKRSLDKSKRTKKAYNRKSSELDKKSLKKIKSLLRQANTYVGREMYCNAELLLNEAFELDPYNIILNFQLGKIRVGQGNYDEARTLFEISLSSKNRLFAITELAFLERIVGNFKKSIEYFEELLVFDYNESLVLVLASLYMKTKRYQDAYDLYKKYGTDLYLNNYFEYERGLTYLESLLGKKITKKDGSGKYLINQLERYDENYALKHIKEHLKENDEKFSHGIFTKNIDLNSLFNTVNIAENFMVDFSTYLNHYIISYPGIGYYSDGRTANHLYIATLANTKNIVLMYPVEKEYEIRYLQIKNNDKKITKTKKDL